MEEDPTEVLNATAEAWVAADLAYEAAEVVDENTIPAYMVAQEDRPLAFGKAYDVYLSRVSGAIRKRAAIERKKRIEDWLTALRAAFNERCGLTI